MIREVVPECSCEHKLDLTNILEILNSLASAKTQHDGDGHHILTSSLDLVTLAQKEIEKLSLHYVERSETKLMDEDVLADDSQFNNDTFADIDQSFDSISEVEILEDDRSCDFSNESNVLESTSSIEDFDAFVDLVLQKITKSKALLATNPFSISSSEFSTKESALLRYFDSDEDEL